MILFPSLKRKDQGRLNDIVASKMVADIDEGTDGDILNAYESRFPRWTLLMEPAKCAMTVRQLAEKCLDYYHHTPSILEMFVLVRSMEDWLSYLENDDRSLRKVDNEDLVNAVRSAKEARDIRRFIKLVCPKPQLLYRVEDLINDALKGGEAYKEAGIKLDDYFEIVPPDIKERLKVTR